MPYDTYWTDKEVLVYGPTANYTVKDYKKFFNDIQFPDGYLMREDYDNLTKVCEWVNAMMSLIIVDSRLERVIMKGT